MITIIWLTIEIAYKQKSDTLVQDVLSPFTEPHPQGLLDKNGMTSSCRSSSKADKYLLKHAK